MATNHWFGNKLGVGTEAEQQLLQDLNDEVIQMLGFDVVYIPRDPESQTKDYFFGEDPLAKFEKHYVIEAILHNGPGFSSKNDLLAKFGIQTNDQLEISFSTRRFAQEVGTNKGPKEGDLIYMEYIGGLYVIDLVEDNENFLPLKSQQLWKCFCSLFQPSHETFDTGYEKIDEAINANFSVDVPDKMDSTSIIVEEAEKFIDQTELSPFRKQ